MTPIPSDMLSSLVTSTEEVFETMVFRKLRSQTPIQGEALRPQSNVVGTVAFAGSRSGVVALYATTGTAHAITGAMLGMDPSEVNGEMPDAIGEVTNMIAGTFRRLASAETPWAISVPTVTVGSDFYTKYVSDVQRALCPFQLDEGEIFVELILTAQH